MPINNYFRNLSFQSISQKKARFSFQLTSYVILHYSVSQKSTNLTQENKKKKIAIN